MTEAAGMSAGDLSGWAQAVGAILAIWAAWWQGQRSDRKRLDAEAEQKKINYEIAEDMFRRISNSLYEAAKMIKDGYGSLYFAGDSLSEVRSSLSMLDILVMAPLPGKEAAIDVQTMRTLGFYAQTQLTRARIAIEQRSPRDDVVKMLIIPLGEVQPYAYIPRDRCGPRNPKDLTELGSRRNSSAPDLSIFDQEIAELSNRLHEIRKARTSRQTDEQEQNGGRYRD
ncbi:hypothetical protein [Ancylobacter sp. 3268]|uniref:hypothetical protein n=1 Tax=Ancylobacter sp. 3268 TaxID=2817752 RepID=UPI002869FC69|nr:hypothetical protein [Ancylobacter sp. 3268]